jgi:hypothetical protein
MGGYVGDLSENKHICMLSSLVFFLDLTLALKFIPSRQERRALLGGKTYLPKEMVRPH